MSMKPTHSFHYIPCQLLDRSNSSDTVCVCVCVCYHYHSRTDRHMNLIITTKVRLKVTRFRFEISYQVTQAYRDDRGSIIELPTKQLKNTTVGFTDPGCAQNTHFHSY